MVNTFRIPFGETAMPSQETDPMFERHHFAQDLASGQWTMSELCARYGIRVQYRARTLHRPHFGE
jgi:hypothetical protein